MTGSITEMQRLLSVHACSQIDPVLSTLPCMVSGLSSPLQASVLAHYMLNGHFAKS